MRSLLLLSSLFALPAPSAAQEEKTCDAQAANTVIRRLRTAVFGLVTLSAGMASATQHDAPFDYGTLPHPLICDVQSRCLESGVCIELDVAAMQHTLVFEDDTWLWDLSRNWDGYPVLVAPNRIEAMALHESDPSYGLAIVAVDGTKAENSVVVDVHRLVQGFSGENQPSMNESFIRFACSRRAAQ